MAAFLAGIYLFSGCKKNVGVITSIMRYDISGYVSESEAGVLSGVEIFQDGKSVATTDAAGKFTISKLLTGTYIIEAKKSGYTKGSFTLKVTDVGGAVGVILLKKLAPAVAVSVSGGTVTGTTQAGVPSAAITIPTGTLAAPVTISVTVLQAIEAPPVPVALHPGTVPGVIVQVDCSDPTITFPNGITLTFVLPFIQKPGSAVKVSSYNETTKVWDSYPNAIVSADGKTASLLIYHFSIWSADVGITFTQTDLAPTTPQVNFPYMEGQANLFQLEFANDLSADIDPIFFVGIAQATTGLFFQTYTVSGIPTMLWALAYNPAPVGTEPLTNPQGFGSLPSKPWEFIQYLYRERGTFSYQVYDIPTDKYVTKNVNCNYNMPAYVWLWRPNDTYAVPTNPGVIHTSANAVSQIVLGTQHSGGSGS